MLLRKSSKSLGSMCRRARRRCPGSSWGIESEPLNSFRMAIGWSSSPAGPIKRTWDVQASACPTRWSCLVALCTSMILTLFPRSSASWQNSRPSLSESSMDRKPCVVELYSQELSSVLRFSHAPVPRFARRQARSRAHCARIAQQVHMRVTYIVVRTGKHHGDWHLKA